jgi:hypothetical protein
MVFVPKRHREQEAEPHGPAVDAAPVAPAEPPADAKPAEQPKEHDPVSAAALKARLAEMERAEQLATRQQPPQRVQYEPPLEPQAEPPTVEQIISRAQIPEQAKAWLRMHPVYVSDPEKNARMREVHNVAQAHGEFTPEYFDRMEVLLGLKQETRPTNGNGASPTPRPAPPQRPTSIAYSAPPTREAPSMSSGRAPSSQMRLTAEEVEIALATKLSPEEPDHLAIQRYAYNKAKGLKGTSKNFSRQVAANLTR